jgi:RIO kinase 1
MSSKNKFRLLEQLEDLDDIPAIRNVPESEFRRRDTSSRKSKQIEMDDISTVAEQENELAFSYSPSKHEKAWLIGSLEEFYRQQWFDDVLRLIKGGGKEASVYQCLGNATTNCKYIAAKVYRPRRFRQLRNDAIYREGRQNLDDEGHEIHDDNALRAIRKRTTFGQRLLHTSWIEHEFQTLQLLYQAGVDVPKPFTSGNNAILMAYIGWDDLPAPTLNMVNLESHERRQVFDRLIHNVEVMLENRRIHADLSAYNVLYFEGEVFLIDFPQAIDPEVNSNAYAIFCRDLSRLCEYFQEQGLKYKPQKLAEDLWIKQGYTVRRSADPRLFSLEDL